VSLTLEFMSKKERVAFHSLLQKYDTLARERSKFERAGVGGERREGEAASRPRPKDGMPLGRCVLMYLDLGFMLAGR